MAKFLDDTGLARFWANLKPKLNAKQDKLTGSPGQVVGFDETGQAVAQDAPPGGGEGGGGVPSGCVMMWPFPIETIPDGWVLCDGTNGTLDFRGCFPLGAGGAYAVGATGGEATHTLTVAEMPLHAHRQMAGTGTKGECVGQVYLTTDGSYPSAVTTSGITGTRYPSTSAAPRSYVSTATCGSGNAHNNMPPYCAVHFIMKL